MKQITQIFILISLVCIIGCHSDSNERSEDSHLGEINFSVAGNQASQGHFNEGLLLLHSFEYDDARDAFLEAQSSDENCTMAYWGEAMTYHHALWQKQELSKAQQALQKLGDSKVERLAKLQSEIEKDLFTAAETLFGEGTKYERDVAYRDYLNTLSNKYPNNNEVSALYAISLLGSSRNGRDEVLYEKAAKIAQGIIKENPNHPGALHYLIHSYDDPAHAHLALGAANMYSKVAPDAAHALHMPSHIYVALGKWDEVVKSNIASWNASYNKMLRNGEGLGKSYHALNWLQYGFLQKGEKELSSQLNKKMQAYAAKDSSASTRSYALAMLGAHMVENNNWDAAYLDQMVKVSDLNVKKRGAKFLLEGLVAYHNKDPKKLQAIILEMSKDRYKAKLRVGEEGFAMCSSGGSANKPPSQIDVDMVKVMELELQGCLADLRDQTKQVEYFFNKACELDEQLNYSFGPPEILKPAHELYGEWLNKKNRRGKAMEMFERSLKRHPRRLLTYVGYQNTLKMLSRPDELSVIEKEIEKSKSLETFGEILL